jgi:competence protein ComEA
VKKEKVVRGLLELNAADSLALLGIFGIGPAYASRILKYREQLGGFVRISQLKEIYGFNTEVYDKLQPQIQVNGQLLKKMNINTATEENLKVHPYVRNRLAKLIISYRQQHGKYASIEDLKKIAIMNDSVFYEAAGLCSYGIKPYLFIRSGEIQNFISSFAPNE